MKENPKLNIIQHPMSATLPGIPSPCNGIPVPAKINS